MTKKRKWLGFAIAMLLFSTILSVNYIKADSGWDSDYNSSSVREHNNSSSFGVSTGITISKDEFIPALILNLSCIGIIVGIAYIKISKIKMIIITSFSSIIYIIDIIYYYQNYQNHFFKVVPFTIFFIIYITYYNFKHWNFNKK